MIPPSSSLWHCTMFALRQIFSEAKIKILCFQIAASDGGGCWRARQISLGERMDILTRSLLRLDRVQSDARDDFWVTAAAINCGQRATVAKIRSARWWGLKVESQNHNPVFRSRHKPNKGTPESLCWGWVLSHSSTRGSVFLFRSLSPAQLSSLSLPLCSEEAGDICEVAATWLDAIVLACYVRVCCSMHRCTGVLLARCTS